MVNHSVGTESLTPFFQPRGVIIIGASTSLEKLGYGAARNLVYSGYNGAIHFMGQKAGRLFNRPIYTDLLQVPDPVDLAVLIVPASATLETLEACGQRGIRAVIVVASGFREAGPEGVALEAECLEVARKHGIRMVGPNCIGSLDTHLPLDTTFLAPPMPARGHIGFVSHSGAFCAAIIDWARNHGFGFSRLISLGNQADVNETDMLPVVASDEQTHVIVLYLEGVADGKRFVEVAREVTRHKPVIALKVGRFESGQRAAASHTGALAGSDRAYEAAFEKAGIFRADSAEQMFDWAQALAAWPVTKPTALSLPKGGGSRWNVAVLTNAGGPGVIAADALEVNGLHISNLSDATRKSLVKILPPAASLHNPVDMLASASPELYAQCLNILLADSSVDAVLVILPPPPMYHTEEVADVLIPIIQNSEKPVLVALLGSELTKEAAKHFQRADIPTYTFPEKAASALGILAKRAEYLIHQEHPGPGWGAGEGTRKEQTLKVLEAFRVSEPEKLLAAYGIPAALVRIATNAGEAAKTACEMGFPVVMKIASADILHKSDIGGVLLDIASEQEVLDGYAQLMEKAHTEKPAARIEGVYLQRQVPPGQEVILGVVQDPQFGPLVMFGSGGVEVEGLKDVAFALGPLTQAEAESLARKTWAGRKLDGYRNIPPADRSAVIEAICRLSLLAAEHPELVEIEINPLRVLSKGVMAVDIRIKT